jgi:hypothetical protein
MSQKRRDYGGMSLKRPTKIEIKYRELTAIAWTAALLAFFPDPCQNSPVS